MTTQPKKKILYLITKSNWGGAQRYVYDLATNLDRSTFEPVVALGGNGILMEMLENAHIRVIPLLQLKNTESVKHGWRAGREIYTLLKIERPDVLHLNSSVAGLVGALVGRLARVPKIIFTAHGWAFNEDRPLWQRLIIKFLHWVTVLLSHRTIAVSSAIVKEMNWPFAEHKMKIVNPGRTIGPMYERDASREKIVDFFPALLPYQTNTWLVCIAELHPIKRHGVLLETLKSLLPQHPNLRLVLIGEGSERANIEAQIEKDKLSENVFLLGNITEAARFLRAFDMFVLSSKSESYGYVLHEAGLAHVPVVATNVGGIPDIITNQKTGLLVPPDNALALQKNIERILNENELSHRLVTALAVELVNRTVEKMTTQTTYLYTV